MGDDDKKQFNIYLPEKLIRAVKIASIDSRRSLSAYVEAALRQQLVIDAKAKQAGEEWAAKYAGEDAP
ncbi:CopG family transcriptional regulator [Deinococcus sp.]|uniref:CopG family transcriptional regulator n=1 Tax=Deinococcus sp. TaxID=47478 RepID=UPI0025D52DFB|nr:CopG family transcriptional regulator [Deinococcus sp.]